MPRVSASAVLMDRSRLTLPFMLPSPYQDKVGTPEVVISELNTWPVRTPVNASPASLRMQVHDSEPRWCATPFLCGSLIRYSMPVYLGASLMTLSARNSIDCGMLTPIWLAVFRLMINSNFVGPSTGKSLGFAPLRILST